MRLIRLLKIIGIALQYGLDEILFAVLGGVRGVRWVRYVLFWRDLSAPRGERLRCALEKLGPIFVKLGQVLSTRRDLVPVDIADELAKLQDRVPPFDTALAILQIEASLGAHPNDLFMHFDATPVASASIAQVYRATLQDGSPVAVKVLRPGVHQRIRQDVALMYIFARVLEKIWRDGKRLKLKEVVAEFDQYLHDELDLMREAANGSQLRRNFEGSTLLLVPKIYWDYCAKAVLVMEWMDGVPIMQIDRLVQAGVDLKKLSRDGVEIFFTQVFRDGFFHADMHPGNILVSTDPKTLGAYIALDFGIVGTLTDHDKRYLAQNFLAFFQRDYRRVATAHIESGWAPKDTRVDALEAAVRTCCEPIFDRPLKDISFGKVLLRLFQTSRRFNIEVQPQLVLLQKTLLNIEGLGRELDSNLDLWQTAKPFLERWMKEQIGWRALLSHIKEEVPHYVQLLPQLPRLLHQTLERANGQEHDKTVLAQQLLLEQRRMQRVLDAIWYTLFGVFVGVVLARGLFWLY